MEKIVVIGPPGAGKTTFAQKLGTLLSIKPIHLDRVFWKRDWEEKSRDTRIDILQKLVLEKQWIIEGSNLSASEPRLEAADTIIFLDAFPLVCLWRIIKRHFVYYDRSRRDIPEGCTDKLTHHQMVKAQTFPLNERRIINQKLRTYKSKQIIRLRSSNEVDDFLAHLKLIVDEKRNAYRTVYVAKTKKRTG